MLDSNPSSMAVNVRPSERTSSGLYTCRQHADNERRLNGHIDIKNVDPFYIYISYKYKFDAMVRREHRLELLPQNGPQSGLPI